MRKWSKESHHWARATDIYRDAPEGVLRWGPATTVASASPLHDPSDAVTTDALPPTKDDFLYDALLLYAKADARFVSAALLPRLLAASLRVATTNSVAEPGLDRIVGLERGLKQARRTLVILSQAFFRRDGADDKFADYLALQSKHADIVESRYSLMPVYVEDLDPRKVPIWLSSLQGVRLGAAAGRDMDPEAELERLLKALARPVPQR